MENVNVDNLKRQFARIGARLETHVNEAEYRKDWHGNWNWSEKEAFSANVRVDEDGEHFTFVLGDNSQMPEHLRGSNPLLHVQVLDCQPKDRHLVLQVTRGDRQSKQVDKMLMGHDERHWFIAGVADRVTTVAQAKDSLKPARVLELERRHKVKRGKRNKHRNTAFIRQGEWFFTPAPGFTPGKFAIISRNEPLIRGGGKPHRAQEACRVGGTTVMVHRRYAPNGISMDAYNKLRSTDPEKFRSSVWRQMTSNAAVYVRGTIKHPDHKTLKLVGWHRVEGNVEPRMATVAFLD